ncbi:MAG: hypothetical protein ACI83O_000548 [Patescibacteria group bacterium]|jgi:hypothetical protein
MQKIFGWLLIGLFLLSFTFVMADSDNNESDDDDDRDDDDRDDDESDDDDDDRDDDREEFRKGLKDLKGEFRNSSKELHDDRKKDKDEFEASLKELFDGVDRSNLTDEEKEELKEEIDALKEEFKETKEENKNSSKELRVEYRGALKDLANATGNSKVHYKLANGRNVTVRVMPENASARALERLGLVNCLEENNCSLELKEVGEGNNTKLRYALSAKKKARFLGLFAVDMDVESEVDAETGEVVYARKPWWAFLASE